MTSPETSLNALSGSGPVFLLASMVVHDHAAYLEDGRAAVFLFALTFARPD